MGVWSKSTPRRPACRGHKRRLLQRQHGRCAWCGCAVGWNSATIDHIVSLLFGGVDELSNMVLACDRCNHERAAVTTWFGHYRVLRRRRHRMRDGLVPDSQVRRVTIRTTRVKLRRRAGEIRDIIAKYQPLEEQVLEIWRRFGLLKGVA